MQILQKVLQSLTLQKSDRKLVCVQVIDIFAQIGVEDPGYQSFQHDCPRRGQLMFSCHFLYFCSIVLLWKKKHEESDCLKHFQQSSHTTITVIFTVIDLKKQ